MCGSIPNIGIEEIAAAMKGIYGRQCLLQVMLTALVSLDAPFKQVW